MNRKEKRSKAMKVRMIGQISGSRDGVMWPAPGVEIDVPKDEAEDLIRNGLAARLDAAEENAMLDVHPELATVPSGNKAVSAEDQRLAVKPAPHADEPDAYHVPELPGERAAAEAGQAAVDQGNAERDAAGNPDAEAPKAPRTRRAAAPKAGK